MAQEILAEFGGIREKLALPDPDEYVMNGIEWGHHCALFTPAFWATLAWLDKADNRYKRYRLGETLEEEIAACLLGGYGIPAEIGLAAFYRVRDVGLLAGPPPSEEAICRILSEPIEIDKRKVHYRFAHQRSKYLSEALNKLHCSTPPTQDDFAFRNWLLECKGIGAKTASWITRNWLDSDKVAIIDIHIHRAGLLMGLYCIGESPAKHYFNMERKFLAFAAGIGVKATTLDTLIWRQMKDAGNIALELIKS
jgi:N-glycosylase/DNA lyase